MRGKRLPTARDPASDFQQSPIDDGDSLAPMAEAQPNSPMLRQAASIPSGSLPRSGHILRGADEVTTGRLTRFIDLFCR
ncbi:MAG: hypothetical protein PVJ07_06630 [Anaerolineales bacterium]